MLVQNILRWFSNHEFRAKILFTLHTMAGPNVLTLQIRFRVPNLISVTLVSCGSAAPALLIKQLNPVSPQTLETS